MNNHMYSPGYIRRELRRVLRLMTYFGNKTSKRFSKIEFENYQALGGYWDMLAKYCKHTYRISKRHPKGRCTVCGTTKK